MPRKRSFRRPLRRNHRSLGRLESLEERRVLDSTVVFNEIMYNPVGGDDARTEWIELYNQLTVDIDISDWVLTGEVEFQFPDHTIVPGKGYLVVAADPQTFTQTTGQQAVGPWTGQLSNGGAELKLYNNDQRLLNVVDYDDEGVWPTAPDGMGATLAKRYQQSNSELAENWTFSQQLGGTPGARNFWEPEAFTKLDLISSPAPVRAIVPADDSLQLSWTLSEFDDTSWLSGTGGVGFDFGTSGTLYGDYLGLDFEAPPNGQPPMSMATTNTTAYIRFPFEAPDRIAEVDSLRLRMRYDDGFVAYLNGVEVAHVGAPGRDGNTDPLTWNSNSTNNRTDSSAIGFETFKLTNFEGVLQPGANVLAIHGLNRNLSDSTVADALWDAELVATIKDDAPPNIPLQISEVAAADSPGFFLEIVNDGDMEVNLGSISLLTDAPSVPRYDLPAQTLAAGARWVVTADQLGRTPGEGDRFLLVAEPDRVLDGVRVQDRLRARSGEHQQQWMNAATPTPGDANIFSLHEDVVINEIMYNAPPILEVHDIPAEYDRSTIVPFTHDQWRYNASGAVLPSDWATQTYDENGSDWLLGQGLIGYARVALPVPINTELTRPSSNDPGFLTYYFQTELTFTAEQIAELDQLWLSHVVDDGVVFYLNGEEVLRYNIPAGPVDATTKANPGTRNADVIPAQPIPLELLHEGVNTLSAEVHLTTERSSDVAFAAEVTGGVETRPLIPGSPYRERSDLEWIELYNKGNTEIDLGGWSIDGGIDYQIPTGTKLSGQQYLVIAKDAAAFAEVYPGVPVLGDFEGTLSNHDEVIRLLDTQQNPADEVHYYEGGRWPTAADAGGSSLELIDPDADNNRGEAWAASDERERSEWITHTFRGISQQDVYAVNTLYNEFFFGLLDAGEFLIDDIQVLKDPSGANRDMIQNGTFETDLVGQSPAKWRIIGNHSGTVTVDPTDASNQVLHVVSTGAQAFVHDHAETTFVDNEDIIDGQEYEISFRAKWLTGNSQLNSRLWFNRLGNTAKLNVPLQIGTPGAANSTQVDNAGPSYADFGHSPVNPTETEDVTVSVLPEDPDGVSSATLYWRRDGEDWNMAAMVGDSNGRYQAVIPPAAPGTITQFYVQSVDTRGATSMFPAAGPDSRALYQVEDGVGPTTMIERFRMIMLQQDRDDMYRQTNIMSNWLLPLTLIHNDTPYYDIGTRLIGSRWIRPNSGYKINLSPENPFNGVHDTIRFDRNGLSEIVMKQMLNRAGGNQASNYDDLAYLVAPRPDHTQESILQLARYENVFLNEQFVDGSDGTKWELDDVTVASGPPAGDVEGLKTGTAVYEQADIGVNSLMVLQQGTNPEFYRGHLLIKNNRAKDDYSEIIRLAQAIHQQADRLFTATNEVLDVDLWMRHYANQSYFGNWDTYGFRRPKNLRIYVRPEDDRFVPLFWDCDLCNFSEPLKTRSEGTSRLDEIRDIPHNLRLFWGHMLDFVNRSFTEEYVADWARRYGELVNNQIYGGDEQFTLIAASTRARSARVLTDIQKDIPQVDFAITTGDGADITVDTPTVTVEGKGWVDIRYLRLAGSDQKLEAFWPEADVWRVELPIHSASQTFTLEAIDYRGSLIATDSITVHTSSVDPVNASLRISEVQYHPADPTTAEMQAGFNDADDFEYIELTNIGDTTISLVGVQFQRVVVGNEEQGIDFDFSLSSMTELAAGQTAIVVEDAAAFRTRYGDVAGVAGQWSGGLSNDSEQITLVGNGGIVHQFSYQDSWYPETDGTGRSLQVVDLSADLADWTSAAGWRPSGVRVGTPGRPEAVVGDANGDGTFDSDDILAILTAGEYEDGIPGNSAYAEGDFNDDGDFTSEDMIWALAYGSYAQPALALSAAPQENAKIAQVSIVDEQEAEGRIRSSSCGSPQAVVGQARSVPIDSASVDAIFEQEAAGDDAPISAD